MEIGIIGAGSVGMLIAGYLGRSHQIHLYSRRFQASSIHKINSIEVKKAEDSFQSKVTSYADIESMPSLDILFICVKQTALESVIKLLKNSFKSALLIFVQNGMSHLEKVGGLPQNILFGIVEHGAKRAGNESVIHSGFGQILVGSLANNYSYQDVIAQMSQNDFKITYQNNIKRTMSKKLIVNAVINPLTAIFKVQNGHILTNSHIKYLAQKINEEAASVMNIDSEISWAYLDNVAKVTAENTSSMLQDMLNHKETEIESILGYLKYQSTEAIPYIDFAYHTILTMSGKEV